VKQDYVIFRHFSLKYHQQYARVTIYMQYMLYSHCDYALTVCLLNYLQAKNTYNQDGWQTVLCVCQAKTEKTAARLTLNSI